MEERAGSMWSYGKIQRRENCSWGEVYQKLGGMEQAGRCFYTDRIDTELGPGLFRLSFGIVDKDGYDGGLLTSERLLFGDPEVFAQSSYVPGIPAVRLGAYGEPADGSFRLGVMLLDRAVRCRLTIRWWAERTEDTPEEEENTDSDSFYINNAPKALKTGQKYQLSCIHPAGNAKVCWKVLTEGGGEITSYGMYTAPQTQGIYQVQAALEGTDRTASIYLMVR